jgi:mono/diheme cytochrome c family protein
LTICLGWLGACDDKTAPAAKADVKKPDEKKPETKPDEKAEEKADAKPDAKADAKPEEKAEEKADAKADEKAADADVAPPDAKADETPVDAKAEEKAEEKKATEKKPEKKPTPAADKPDPGPAIDGKDLFAKKCKNCHNANGDGKTKIGEENKVEDWTAAGWKAKWSQAKIEAIVTNGEAGTKMKPFKDKLTPEEIVAVSKYARSLGK